MTHFIIIANGNFPKKDIILEAMEGKTIISLDGAANTLIRMNIQPDVILGDFDSIHPDHLISSKAIIIHAEDQNLTDLRKGIRYCDSQGAASISIVCATGGRMDHHEASIRCLRSEYKPDRPILIHTEQQTIRFAKDEDIILKGEIGDKCGILAYPAGLLSSQGLEYDVQNYELIFGFTDSTSNALKQKEANLSIQGEALIVMPPQLQAQRYFLEQQA